MMYSDLNKFTTQNDNFAGQIIAETNKNFKNLQQIKKRKRKFNHFSNQVPRTYFSKNIKFIS